MKKPKRDNSPSEEELFEAKIFNNSIAIKRDRPGLEFCVGVTKKKRKGLGVATCSRPKNQGGERSEISKKFAELARKRKEEFQRRDRSPPPYCRMGSQEFEDLEQEIEKIIEEGEQQSVQPVISEESRQAAKKYAELERQLQEKTKLLGQESYFLGGALFLFGL